MDEVTEEISIASNEVNKDPVPNHSIDLLEVQPYFVPPTGTTQPHFVPPIDMVQPHFIPPIDTVQPYFVPSVDDELIPKLGMVFDSLAEGERFYYAYAKAGIFEVRKYSSNYEEKTKELIAKTYVCAKEGHNKPRNIESHIVEDNSVTKSKIYKNRGSMREGCNARIRLRKNKDGRWKVVNFVEHHNHMITTPRKKHLLNSNRQVTDSHKSSLHAINQANIGTSKCATFLAIQAGGYDKSGCLEVDLRNYLRDVKEMTRNADAQLFINNLKKLQDLDPAFYFAFDVDEETLKNVFWADGQARKNLMLFGDVVDFDTTYDTNMYSMIFAPFTRVNHHKQSTNFGAALLCNEKAETFTWLFSKFVDAMGSNRPHVIITDQDPAMSIAIAQVFGSMRHRFCMWHILKKVSEKIGAVFNANERFHSEFKHCVFQSEMIEEFESKWDAIINRYNLENNRWLADMYNLREKWIPAFFKDVFLAGMNTTQRSESMNAFFSHFTSEKRSLMEFYFQFERAISKQREFEKEKDYSTVYRIPNIKFHSPMELQMSKIYTHTVFYEFQEELSTSFMNCGTSDIQRDDTTIVYEITKGEKKSREVVYDTMTNIACCSYKLLEGEGIPCSHILVVLKNRRVQELSVNYIQKRWTRFAMSTPIFDDAGNELGKSIERVSEQKYFGLWEHCIDFMREASKSDELFLKAKKLIIHAIDSLTEYRNSIHTGGQKNNEYTSSMSVVIPDQIDVHPPNVSKTRGSGKRLKDDKEIAIEQQKKKPRLCHNCNEVATHDKRNCPLLEQ